MYIRTNMFQFAQFLLHQNEDHGTRTHTRTQCLDRELARALMSNVFPSSVDCDIARTGNKEKYCRIITGLITHEYLDAWPTLFTNVRRTAPIDRFAYELAGAHQEAPTASMMRPCVCVSSSAK